MARGRMINTSITRDEEFNEMSIDAQFLFMRTVPFLDRDGLITGNTALLWSDVAPLLSHYASMMDAIISEWCENGFCIKYKDGKKDVLFFPSFRKNQFGMRYEKEAPSQFPPPPGYIRTRDGLKENNCKSGHSDGGGQGTDKVRTEDGKGTLEEEVEEEEKGNNARTQDEGRNEKNPPPLASPEPEQQAQPEPVTATEAEQPTADEFTWQPTTGEYMPGLPNPKRNRERESYQYRRVTQVNETIAAAGKIGVDAVTFRQMVDAYLTRIGKKKLADMENDTGEQTLFEAQNTILDLCVLDRMFRTVASVGSVFDSWLENSWAWATTPSKKQFLEHASQMASGTVKNEKNPPKATKGKPTVEAEERVNFSAKALYS